MKTLLFIISIGGLGIFSLIANNDTTTATQLQNTDPSSILSNTPASSYKSTIPAEIYERWPEQKIVKEARQYKSDNNPVTYDEDPQNSPLSRPKTYYNVDQIEVQSPTKYKSVPPGACAVCRDGTYSFSRNRRGTCSHHGGVASWLN